MFSFSTAEELVEMTKPAPFDKFHRLKYLYSV